jgi:hypothetical protein
VLPLAIMTVSASKDFTDLAHGVPNLLRGLHDFYAADIVGGVKAPNELVVIIADAIKLRDSVRKEFRIKWRAATRPRAGTAEHTRPAERGQAQTRCASLLTRKLELRIVEGYIDDLLPPALLASALALHHGSCVAHAPTPPT